ncbi:hypothetical protein M2139_001424 [Enterococcus sp. PF1-24]|nr:MULTISPECIES: DUF4044 domain-containing protein [unclassified Enterococcus]MDH6364437.1 hypothetical protein [Enterococcus sp. PFB1-1]MDH6401540.1 hypothetical protein [Enterococcus sp. PF1-24]
MKEKKTSTLTKLTKIFAWSMVIITLGSVLITAYTALTN